MVASAALRTMTVYSFYYTAAEMSDERSAEFIHTFQLHFAKANVRDENLIGVIGCTRCSETDWE